MLLPQKTLLEALKKVWLTVSDKKDASELHKCLCFADNKVSSFNGHAGLITKCELNGLAFIVKADLLFSLVKSLSGDIEFIKDVGSLTIKAGKHKTKIGLYNSDSFFDVIPARSDKFCEATNLIDAIKKVKFSISTNKSKPELCGIAFYNEHVYSCDNKSVTRVKLNAPVNGYINFPSTAIDVLESVGQPDYLFLSGNGLVGFLKASEKTVFTSTSQVGLLPVKEIDQMLSKPVSGEVIFPTELPEVIKRLKLVMVNNLGLAEMSFTHKDGVLTIHAQNKGVGEAEESIDWPDCKYEFTFNVNPDLLLEVLKFTHCVDLTDVLSGQRRSLRFVGEGFDHIMGLMT